MGKLLVNMVIMVIFTVMLLVAYLDLRFRKGQKVNERALILFYLFVGIMIQLAFS